MLDKEFYFVVSLQYQIKNTNKMKTIKHGEKEIKVYGRYTIRNNKLVLYKGSLYVTYSNDWNKCYYIISR